VPLAPATPPPNAITLVQPSRETTPCDQSVDNSALVIRPGLTWGPTGAGFNPRAEATSCHLIGYNHAVDGGGCTIDLRVRASNNVNADIAFLCQMTLAPGQTSSATQPIPSGTFNLTLQSQYNSGTGGSSSRGSTLQAYCGTDVPGGTQLPCCPPDDATFTQLASILDIVKSMQRFYHPFAVNQGLTFSARQGTGTIACQRIVGVLVFIDQPHGGQTSPGNPPYLYDNGWLSIHAQGALLQERRFSQQQFWWYPEKAPLADEVAYQLNPGVIATISLLQAEP
jgi:hypothetical protein